MDKKTLAAREAARKIPAGGAKNLAASEAAKKILAGNAGSLHALKLSLAEKYGLSGPLKNSEILACIPEEKRTRKALSLLRLRPTRTLSGVSPVAVMTRSGCPHGECLYCPRGKDAAQSYTGEEPASLRARQNDFDPYRQVAARIRQYEQLGHPTDKCELILMGGTFLAQPGKKVRHFVKRCFDAFNGEKSKTLEEAKKKNETARHRVVGLTFETRPDYAKQKHVDLMLALGATRVELGVQTLSDAVYKKVNRGHTVADAIEATRICRDAGLKICYHMMPGLFSTLKQDVETFRTLFSSPHFQPDMLKIYPCMVMKGTGLHKLWKAGKYKPYTTDEAAAMIADATKFIPPYTRVMRVQRDIPSQLVVAGVKNSNLRQIVDRLLAARGEKCRCIRCREIRGGKAEKTDVRLSRTGYNAGRGKEIFISFEDKRQDKLIGFLRLRIPSSSARRPEITKKTAIVRELHVYGGEVSIGEKESGASQHSGYGARLLREAEKIAKKEFGKRKLIIISGVGARGYYRKFGYGDDGHYLSKPL